MDLASLIGIILGFSVVVGSAILMKVDGRMFLDPGAAILIIGGTFAATMISFPMDVFLNGITAGFKNVFVKRDFNEEHMIATLVSFAEKARREGLLALESEAGSIDDDFLRKGIQLVIDGRDTEVIRKILETEVNFHHERAQKQEQVFSTAGGFAPTMGIIGTVLGLISMLSQLGAFGQSGDVAGKLGEATASAFIATFLGILTANLLWLPCAGKLKARANQENLFREIQIEGILAVQAGDNPRLLEEKLHAYLDPKKAQEEVKAGGGTTEAAPAGA